MFDSCRQADSKSFGNKSGPNSIDASLEIFSEDHNAQIVRSSSSSSKKVNDDDLKQKEEGQLTATLLSREGGLHSNNLEEIQPKTIPTYYSSLSTTNKNIIQSIIVILFVFLTWGLSSKGHRLGPNLAAASTATAAYVILPDFFIVASIGSYGGMMDIEGRWKFMTGVACCVGVSAICFETFGWFAGKGGRLGTSAFIGCVTTLGVLYFCGEIDGTMIYDFSHTSYNDVNKYVVFNIIGSNLLGVSATYLLRLYRPQLSPVAAGNAICMFLIIILDSFLEVSSSGDEIDVTTRNEAAGSMLCGSFVAMSSFSVLPNFAAAFIAGLFSSGVTLLLFPVFPYGVGGKRGVMAFVAVIVFDGLNKAVKHLRKKSENV